TIVFPMTQTSATMAMMNEEPILNSAAGSSNESLAAVVKLAFSPMASSSSRSLFIDTFTPTTIASRS
ncbi:hypothetical protein PFISCL1PPCAC_18897, partial [Pristionchus fissidentatus]